MFRGRRRATGLVAVWAAAVVGLVHAGFSAYWALGGTWLLPSVGRWAVELSERGAASVGIALGLVAVVKVLGVLVPIALAHGRLRAPRSWRAATWCGGLVLVAYGGVNTVVALGVLHGVVRPADGYDVAAMRGHAYLWDPLFLIWGSALVTWLWLSRRPSSAR